jgi:TENA/THI-4/PQQC family
VRREDLARFAGEQHHIIRSDLRSVALLVNRFGATPSGPFFQAVLGGETEALAALGAFAAAVGMDDARLQAYEPAPGAHAYTTFMAWLALYGSEAEVAAGLVVNFAAWGANCGRMSRALRDRYGLTDEATAFFDLFAAPPGEFESQAMTVVAGGLARGAGLASSSARPGSSRASRSSTGTRSTQPWPERVGGYRCLCRISASRSTSRT